MKSRNKLDSGYKCEHFSELNHNILYHYNSVVAGKTNSPRDTAMVTINWEQVTIIVFF